MSERSPRRRRVLATLSAAGTGVLAGCSGLLDDESDADESTSTAATDELASPTAEAEETPTPDPAASAFEITGVSLTENVQTGAEVEVTVSVTNTGDADGAFTVRLAVDGEPITARTLDVPAGETDAVTFSHVYRETGDFDVRINDEPVGTITVEERTDYHVAPDGSDDDLGSEASPLASIREGLQRAHPGDTIHLAPGEYREERRTVRSGEPDAPITITGPPEAVWRAHADTAVLFDIVHSHIHLRGITMNGLIDEDGAYEDRHAYANTLVQVSPWATQTSDELEPVDYLEGVVVEPSRIGNCATNLIFVTRLRDASIGGFELFGPAGMDYHPDVENGIESHVGEIIYLGTSPSSLRPDHPHPWETIDRTRNVRIHHIDNSAGYHHSEMVDIKLGCTDVTVEYCTDRGAGGQTDGITAGAISPKGNDCTIRWNDLGDCPVGMEFDPWAPLDDVDAIDWAEGNEIYGNYVHDYSRAAFLFQETENGLPKPDDQRVFCGNRVEGPDVDEYAYATGDCDEDVPTGDGVGHTVGQQYQGVTSCPC